MCITFFYINPRASKNEYRLIIVANRDEFYNRKSIPAHFWEEDNSIVGGRDLESPSQGTWLAASKKGKIGILLNIDIRIPKSEAISRGVLVSDFLKEDSNAREFCQNLISKQRQFNGFHLLLFDLNSNDISAFVQTNSKKDISKVEELEKGYHGFSNSPESPYKKVISGKTKFEGVVNQYNSIDQRDVLLNELLAVLKSEEKHYPDDVLFETKKLVMDEQYIEKLGSVFVRIPEKSYGTRTHTIILVTQENEIDFNEFTMKEPIDLNNVEWIHSYFLVKSTT
ncbi:transport and Golgi organization 2 homolog [Planococcus citri]|uniref:transport and Golgi organization 2 homolog n=1 Tax=Planococcus citri TaxID=170843 RepID=UPI0031F97913